MAYKLDLSRSRLNVHPAFHVSLLHPHHRNGVAFNVPPIDVEEDTEWELRDIVSHRDYRGEKQFLVRFKGYDDSENRWMTAGELGNAPDLLAEYCRQHGLSLD